MGRPSAAAKRPQSGRRARTTASAAPSACRAWRPQAGPPAHIVERQRLLQARFAEQRRKAAEIAATKAVREAALPNHERTAEPVVVAFHRPADRSETVGRPPAALQPGTARRLAQYRAASIALFLIPSALTATFASFIASRGDAPVPASSVIAMPVRPTVHSAREIDVAATLPPRPAFSTLPPAFDPRGEIQFSTLRLPPGPPDMQVAMPVDIASMLPTPVLPSAPPHIDVPGDIQVAAVTVPLALPDSLLPPALPDAAPVVAVVPPAASATDPAAQCVAEAGFTLAANPKLPAAAVRPADETPHAFGIRLAQAARAQTASLVIYNARYSRISYPGGDVTPFYGVCSDVIVRAYRALGIDLQVEIAEASVGSGDRNIDHRRVEVMRKFLARFGESLDASDMPESYQAGDVVTYYRPQNKSSTSHIAIVGDVIGPSGQPMIVHNRGWGVQLEDALFVDKITGHYRYSGRKPSVGASALGQVLRNQPASAKPAAVAAPAEAARFKPKAPGGSTVAKAGGTARALP